MSMKSELRMGFVFLIVMLSSLAFIVFLVVRASL